MVVGLVHSPEAINGRELSAYEYSEAGVISGVFTRLLIQPLDMLKIRFQAFFYIIILLKSIKMRS